MGTTINDPKGPEYIPLANGQTVPEWFLTTETTTWYFIQTDQEIVNIQSNIVLPSWLRAYNESWGNTYVEYLTASLSAIPEIDQGQQAIIFKGFSALFIGFWLVFSFSYMIVFLFRLLSFKWTK